jgi:NAD(P)-dependent dehydrogenase (short-subunit alcohol dehydrogenase family)
MSSVSVITGGAGGMGVATARILGREHALVLCDNRADRLEVAEAALTEAGIAVTPVHADVTDRDAVVEVFTTATTLGPLASVVHTAGLSPSMGGAEVIMRTNALGTVNVNEVFFEVAPEGAAIVNVASMAAHLLPEEMIPTDSFPLAQTAPEEFLAVLLPACEIAGETAASGLSYALSKSFVRWYSSAKAERFNTRGLRIVSVSPGSTDTEMGRLEEQAGAGAMVTDAAVPRWGRPEEMAELFAFCVSPRAGYLTGTDILNDGGVVASMRERARRAAQNG